MITLYGIPNCDTVAKARRWLAANDVEYNFHDFKKQGLDKKTVSNWLKHTDWSLLINKRGTTYRKLSDNDKNKLDKQDINLLIKYPSIIKRPVWQLNDTIIIGFKDDTKTTLEGLI